MKKEIIFLPIKPSFLHSILSGEKKWEYRKVIPQKPIEKLVLYSSSPEKKILAIAEVVKIKSASPQELWRVTRKQSGISKTFFDTYFKGKSLAHGIQIGRIIPLIPTCPKLLNIRVPQSFIYLNGNQIREIHKLRQFRVLISGAHGVGKSYTAKELNKHYANSRHIECSHLLKFTGSKNDVASINENQKKLISTIEKAQFPEKILFLDGHLSLLTNGKPTVIPLGFFQNLKVDLVILLTFKPEDLNEADEGKITFDQLIALQNSEILQANRLEKCKHIPFHLVHRIDSPVNIINNIINKILLES